MSNYGEMLLSKVIDNNDVAALTRYHVEEADFLTSTEREAYKFITGYGETNRGQAPDFRTVVSEIKDFAYRPEISDSYEFLVKQLKGHRIKAETMNFVNKELKGQFEKNDGFTFIDWLIEKATEVKEASDFRTKVGTELSDSEKFLDEYTRRKNGESVKIYKSKFGTINEATGGYLSGNTYTWYGRPGRGKSAIVMEEAIEAAMQGATVLIWAMEMSSFEWFVRAYVSISGRLGIATASIDGVDYEAGFDSRDVLLGELPEDWEEKFFSFVRSINDVVPGKIILRAVDDEDFLHRGIKQLHSDILQTKADVVVVDPIYYMDYEANTSNVAGGDVANTSKKLRYVAGNTKTVIHVITQAEEVRDDTDEDGNREIRPPKRAEVKKTKAVIEDAVNTFGIDTLDGRFKIVLGKGRNGGEGTEVEGTYLPRYGIVKEVSTEELTNKLITDETRDF